MLPKVLFSSLPHASLLQPAPLLPVVACLIIGIVVGFGHTVAPLILLPPLLIAVLTGRWPVVQSIAIGCTIAAFGAVLTTLRCRQLTPLSTDGTVVVEAVVAAEPQERARTVAVDVLTTDGAKLKAYLAKSPRSLRLAPGVGIRMCTRVEPTTDWRQGNFSLRRFRLVEGFRGQCYAAEGQWQSAAVSVARLSLLARLRIRFLKWRHQLLSRFVPEKQTDDTQAVLAAMVLGDKSSLTRELRDVYSVSGASHILALSGLHMGVVVGLMALVFRSRRWRVASSLMLLAGCWGFALLTGLSQSVVRAALMFSICTLLWTGRRRQLSVNALCLAAIVMLIIHPLVLFDVGFQLSFSAVLAILLVVPLALQLRPVAFSHPAAVWLWSFLAVSIAAQLGTAPLVAYHFGRLPCYFLVTNLLVIPMTTVLLWGALAAMVVPMVLPLLLTAVSWLNKMLAMVAGWPMASIEGLRPSTAQVAALYVALVALYYFVAHLSGLHVGLHVAQPAQDVVEIGHDHEQDE